MSFTQVRNSKREVYMEFAQIVDKSWGCETYLFQIKCPGGYTRLKEGKFYKAKYPEYYTYPVYKGEL